MTIEWRQVCGVDPFSVPLNVVHFMESLDPVVLAAVSSHEAAGWTVSVRVPGGPVGAVAVVGDLASRFTPDVVVLHGEAVDGVAAIVRGRLPTLAVRRRPVRLPARSPWGPARWVHAEVVAPSGVGAGAPRWYGTPRFIADPEQSVLLAAVICRTYAYARQL